MSVRSRAKGRCVIRGESIKWWVKEDGVAPSGMSMGLRGDRLQGSAVYLFIWCRGPFIEVKMCFSGVLRVF